MSKYMVKFEIPLYFTVEAEADSKDEAIKNAYSKIEEENLQIGDNFYDDHISLMDSSRWGSPKFFGEPTIVKD